jgi:hypothetical protein
MKKFFFLLFLPSFCFSASGYQTPWGKDSKLIKNNKETEAFLKPSTIAKVANTIILFRQKVLTKIDGPRSNFRPTSSRYMQLAIQRYGFFKGYIMGCDRLLRENNDNWIYRTVLIDNVLYNYDPAVSDKYLR